MLNLSSESDRPFPEVFGDGDDDVTSAADVVFNFATSFLSLLETSFLLLETSFLSLLVTSLDVATLEFEDVVEFGDVVVWWLSGCELVGGGSELSTVMVGMFFAASCFSKKRC